MHLTSYAPDLGLHFHAFLPSLCCAGGEGEAWKADFLLRLEALKAVALADQQKHEEVRVHASNSDCSRCAHCMINFAVRLRACAQLKKEHKLLKKENAKLNYRVQIL